MTPAEKLARALELMLTMWGSGYEEGESPSIDKAREALADWRSQQAVEVAQEPLGHVLIGSLGLGSFEAGRHPPPGWVGLPGLRAVYTAEQLQAAREAGRQLGMEQARADGVKCARHGAYMCGSCWTGAGQARREPLTVEQAVALSHKVFGYNATDTDLVAQRVRLVREAEWAHGIPTPPAGDSDTP